MLLLSNSIVKRKKIIIFTTIFLLTFFILAQGVIAGDYGLTETAGGAGLPTSEVGTDIPTLIGQIVGAGLAFIGIIFFLLIIYGGFMWMTARGNEQQVTKAKDLIASAVIGLVIVLAAYAITYYIGTTLTGG